MARSDVQITVKAVGVKQAIRALIRLALICMILDRLGEPLSERLAMIPSTWTKARAYLDETHVGRIEALWWAAWLCARLARGTMR